MRTKNLNSLLVEILFAMLFFAISATVILQIFVSARTVSDQASTVNEILVAAQNLADEVYASDELSPSEIILENGVVLAVEYTLEETAGGVLRHASVKAADPQGELLFELPCTRYLPGKEVAE